MPSSNLACAPWVLNLVEQIPQADRRSVLDVGPGFGKYERLLREYLNNPPDRIDAIEAWPEYVVRHGLDARYDDVMVGNVCEIAQGRLDSYDLVLMVDVIEHIDKTAARFLLDRIPGWVVICTPVEFFSNGPGLPPTEEHVSAWGPDDWTALGDRVDQCFEQLGGWFVRLRPKP
jgi:hypothetical protein